MFRASLAHHQGLHSCIQQSSNVNRLSVQLCTLSYCHFDELCAFVRFHFGNWIIMLGMDSVSEEVKNELVRMWKEMVVASCKLKQTPVSAWGKPRNNLG